MYSVGVNERENQISGEKMFQSNVYYYANIKCVSGPGDVWACPRVYRFIWKTENVGQTISDPLYKLIVYTLPSI